MFSKNISTTLPLPDKSYGMCSSNSKEELPEIFYYHKIFLLFERYFLIPVRSKDLTGFFSDFHNILFQVTFLKQKSYSFLGNTQTSKKILDCIHK